MFLTRIIKKHWTVVPPVKTPEQEERERNLFLIIPGIPFSRWTLFAAAFMIQFCCGSLYAWSVFNTPIDTLIYKDALAGLAVNTFYIAVACFGFTALIMGPWLERNGPRKGVLVGSFMFLLGKSVAAISLHYSSIVGVYIGYGVLCGFGLGLNYICPVSCLQKWFPDYRGVASGFAVGGFGAGSVVWAQVYLPLVARVGLDETFAIIGGMFFVVFCFCSVVLRTPPVSFIQEMNTKMAATQATATPAENPEKAEIEDGAEATRPVPVEQTYTLIDAIKSSDYWLLYIVFFANQLFGLVALSRLSNMAVELFGKTKTEGANLVAINGVFNCCGRLVFPMLSDLAYNWFGNRGNRFSAATARKTVFFVALVGQVVIVSVCEQLINSQNYNGFRGAMWTLTALYGAGFGVIPAFLANMWGPYNVGALHGMILTAWSIGGVGGGLGFNANYNMFKKINIRQAYIFNFKWILAILVVGLFCLSLIRTNPEHRSADGHVFSFFGIKLFQTRGKGRKNQQHQLQNTAAHPQTATQNPGQVGQQAGGPRKAVSPRASPNLHSSAGLRRSSGIRKSGTMHHTEI